MQDSELVVMVTEVPQVSLDACTASFHHMRTCA